MIVCFDNHGVKIAEITTDPDRKTATARRATCMECVYLNVKDECWHPSQKCATRTRPWQFTECPYGAWPNA